MAVGRVYYLPPVSIRNVQTQFLEKEWCSMNYMRMSTEPASQNSLMCNMNEWSSYTKTSLNGHNIWMEWNASC